MGEIHEPVCIWLFVSSLPGPVLTFALYYVHVNKTDKKKDGAVQPAKRRQSGVKTGLKEHLLPSPAWHSLWF